MFDAAARAVASNVTLTTGTSIIGGKLKVSRLMLTTNRIVYEGKYFGPAMYASAEGVPLWSDTGTPAG